MEERFCPQHKVQCYLKTCSSSNNTLYTKSFYICPLWPESCSFKRPADLLPSLCPQHQNSIVELQKLKTVQTQSGSTEKRNYYRCKKQKETKQTWCNFYVLSKTENKENIGIKKLFPVNTFYTKNHQNMKPIKTMPPLNEKEEGNSTNKLQWRSPNVNSFHEPLRTSCYSNATSKTGNKNLDKKEISTTFDKHTGNAKAMPCPRQVEKEWLEFEKAEFTGTHPKEMNMHKSFPNVSSFGEHLYATKQHVQHEHGKHEWRDSSEAKQLSTIKSVATRPEIHEKLTFLNHKLRVNQKLKNSVDINRLPDKGAKLISQITEVQEAIEKLELGKETEGLQNVVEQNSVEKKHMPVPVQQQLRDFVGDFQKRSTFQETPSAPLAVQQQQPSCRLMQGDSSMNQTKFTSITQEAVKKLHSSLQSCPPVTEKESDPSLLNTNLMPHQRQALAWLLWREKQEPPGGILADDMGLGKTLTMISLIIKSKKPAIQEVPQTLNPFSRDVMLKGKVKEASTATLVVCPASVLHQWAQEIQIHCRPRALKVLIYHGPDRTKNPKRIASYDVVLTTYATICKEVGSISDKTNLPVVQKEVSAQDCSLLRVAWQRLVLDEAHTIKNPDAQTSRALCQIEANHRWAMTGTPVHNKLMDIFSLLRFLRCSPFDNLAVWKMWVDNSSDQGTTRLNTLVKSLMLRRTKDQKDLQGLPLLILPSREAYTHTLTLGSKEQLVYNKLIIYTRSAVERMYKRQVLRKEMAANDLGQRNVKVNLACLVLVLRLQQCCNHLSLLKTVVAENTSKEDVIKQIDSLNICEDAGTRKDTQDDVFQIVSEHKDDAEFQENFSSTKITALLSHLYVKTHNL